VLVRAEETVDDSVVASGDTVVIEGTITGDLIAAGRRIVVRGIVKGDLLTVSQRVEVEGSVEGNLFSAAETVVLRGPVVRNAYAFAQELHVERSGRVEGDLTGFAAEVAVDGRVGRDLMAFAGATRLRGEVARKADVRTGGLHVEGSGRIGGDLLAHVEHADDVRLDPGAQIAGRTETRVLPPRKSRYLRPGFYVWRAIWLVAAFVSGLLLRRLHPDLFPLRLPDGRSLPRALGTGFVTLVALPAAAILAAVTLVGLPLGLFGLALWLAALYVAPLLVAAPVGRLLLQRPGGPPASFAPPFLLGLLVLTLITNVPYVGCLVRLAVVVLGLGIGVTRLRPGTPLVEA
jgi:cytoskeletal protein CcmA (bactofilin family)